MSEKNSFLTSSEYGDPISQPAFRRMRRQKKLDLMVEWFHQNFEDPTQRLPYESAEGGFQWIWGGPADAEEEIREKFEGTVTEALIKEAIEKIQSDGIYEWSPTPSHDEIDHTGFDDDEDSGYHIDGSMDDIPDQYGPGFGSPEEKAARDQVVNSLLKLDSEVRKQNEPGIGHNRPPLDKSVRRQADTELLVYTSHKLREELEKDRPRVSVTKRLARVLGRGLTATISWVGKKIDVVVDEALKNATRVAIVAPFLGSEPHVQAAVKEVFGAVVKWLHLATLPF